MNSDCGCCNQKVCICCNSFIKDYTKIKGGKRQHSCDHNEHFEKCEHGDCICKCHEVQDSLERKTNELELVNEDFKKMKDALATEIRIAKTKLSDAESSGNIEHETIATNVLNTLLIVEGTYTHDHSGSIVRDK